jgi:hypoxanthine-guanine phosphoribosyltransferase
LCRTISRDYAGWIVDVVIMLENSVLFAADLVGEISNPVVCEIVRSGMRGVPVGGYAGQVEARELNLQAEYMCFAAASKERVGYGLGGQQGRYRNLPYVAANSPGASRAGPQGPDRKVSGG